MKKLAREPYVVAAGALAVLMAIHTSNQLWGTDFWTHAAAVRELSVHPFDPRHPLLGIEEPSVFLSPWSSAVGLASRLTGSGPVVALAVAGMAHLVLILIGLRAFVARMSPHRWAPFWALLFTLLLWGPGAWRFSGFLHLDALGFVLPNPSMFGLGVALGALVLAHDELRRPARWRLALVAAAGPLLVLVHPMAATLFFVGVVSVAWAARVDLGHRILVVLAPVAASAALVPVWPYFPFLELAFSELEVWDVGNRVMYDGALVRVAPALVGVPALGVRLRRNHRDPLALMAVVFLGLYVYGEAADAWSWGRMISPLVLVLHVAAADVVAGHQRQAAAWIQDRPGRVAAAALAGTLLLGLAVANASSGLLRAVPKAALPASIADDERLRATAPRYAFLEAHLDEGDTVMANVATGWPVPAFGGKIVVPRQPQAFVDDQVERFADLSTFFHPETEPADRRRIVDRYRARWVLVDLERDVPAPGTLPRWLADIGTVTAIHEDLVLLRL